MDDVAAVKACREGDSEAFRYLVERYQSQALGHAIALIGNRADALDATQEAFIDAFRAVRQFDLSRPFYPWLYTLLRNRCFKLSARKREISSIEDVEIVSPHAQLSNEDVIGLEKALQSISKEAREIVTLKYFDGLSYDELAERLQIPKGTVMSRLFHARRQLKAELSKVEGAER